MWSVCAFVSVCLYIFNYFHILNVFTCWVSLMCPTCGLGKQKTAFVTGEIKGEEGVFVYRSVN